MAIDNSVFKPIPPKKPHQSKIVVRTSEETAARNRLYASTRKAKATRTENATDEPVKITKVTISLTEFKLLLAKYSGDLKLISDVTNIKYLKLLKRVRQRTDWSKAYSDFVTQQTLLVDNIVRNRVASLKDKITDKFEGLLDANNEKAILQGMKDIVTPLIVTNNNNNVIVNVAQIERSPNEIKELADKLLNTLDVEKI